MSYNRLEKNVVLVPVNNSPFPSQGTDRSVIVKRLNEIYGPAVVNWNVSIDAAIEVLNIKEVDFMVEGTALLSKYTSDMNRVIRTYKRDRVTDDNTLYLFFMTLSNLGSSRKGFMPLAGNYGFIFNFEAQDLELLAHELAHGAFNLRHTFSDKSVYYFTVNQTANLMDYAGGVELWKYQWDLIHNPESILFAWTQGEEEGASMSDDICFKLSNLKNNFVDYFKSDNSVNVFDHMVSAYDGYLDNIKENGKDITLTDYSDWAVSASSYNSEKNKYLAKAIFDKLKDDKNPSLGVNRIYLGTYNIEGNSYKTAMYSYKTSVDIRKFTTNKLCDLVDNKSIRVATKDGYILIDIFDEKGGHEAIVQIFKDDLETVKIWLHYLGIYSETSDWDEVQKYWASLFGGAETEIEALFEEKEELTPSEISDVRDKIKTIEDEEKKKELYLELQKKVPYHNQRNNQTEVTKISTNEDVKIGDVMCNVTSMAMALEMLGLENPCAPDPEQFEDCIEEKITYESSSTFSFSLLNDGDEYDDAREYPQGRQSALTNMFEDKIKTGSKIFKVKTDVDNIKNYLIDKLGKGYGVIVSYGGHFIRIISCDDNGYFYDDPYGSYSIVNTDKGRSWGNYNVKDSEISVGKNNERKWSDFDVLTSKRDFKIEYYYENE